MVTQKLSGKLIIIDYNFKRSYFQPRGIGAYKKKVNE